MMADPSTGSGQADEGEDQAARAFESLRAEVSLMRRAVERLAAERAEVAEAPDYSETLGVMSRNLSATVQRIDTLVKSPALSMTPETIGRQIDTAGHTVRMEDHRVFLAARQGLEDVAARLGRHLQSNAAAGEQRRRLWQVGLAGLGRACCCGRSSPARSPAPTGELAAAGADGGAQLAHADVGRRATPDAGRRRAGVRRRAGGQPAGDRQPRHPGSVPQAGGQGEEGRALRDRGGDGRVVGWTVRPT